MSSRERSCPSCKKWFSCERVEKEEVWNKPPEVRDIRWAEIACECKEWENWWVE